MLWRRAKKIVHRAGACVCAFAASASTELLPHIALGSAYMLGAYVTEGQELSAPIATMLTVYLVALADMLRSRVVGKCRRENQGARNCDQGEGIQPAKEAAEKLPSNRRLSLAASFRVSWFSIMRDRPIAPMLVSCSTSASKA